MGWVIGLVEVFAASTDVLENNRWGVIFPSGMGGGFGASGWCVLELDADKGFAHPINP